MHLSKTQEKLIGTLFVHGAASRKHLAEILGVTKAAITLMTNELINRGAVEEVGVIEHSRVGRKEILINLVPRFSVSLGIDIKPERVKVTIMNLNGSIVYEANFKDLHDAVETIKKIKTRYPNILGLGVSMRKFQHTNKHLFQSIIDEVEALDLQTYYLNNVASLALSYKHTSNDSENFMLVKYGPGVGSAIVIEDKLLHIEGSKTSEIGHMVLDYGNEKTLEEMIVYESVLGFDEDDESVIDYFKNHKQKLHFVIEHLARSIYNAHVLLSLEKIVIAGQIFSDTAIYNLLVKELLKYQRLAPNLRIEQVSDYKEKNLKKAALIPIHQRFLSQ